MSLQNLLNVIIFVLLYLIPSPRFVPVSYSEAYSKPSQTPKMERSAKIVNG